MFLFKLKPVDDWSWFDRLKDEAGADIGGPFMEMKGRMVVYENNEDELITRDEDIDKAARSLKAMSHPIRLKILCVLGDQEISVQDIVDQVGTSQSNVSQHLAILRDKDILASRKDANRVFYRVGDPGTLKLICMMRDVFCSQQ